MKINIIIEIIILKVLFSEMYLSIPPTQNLGLPKEKQKDALLFYTIYDCIYMQHSISNKYIQ